MDRQGCFHSENVMCQFCISIIDSGSFHSQVSKDYKIDFSLNCISFNVVYLFACVVLVFSMWVVLSFLLELHVIFPRC